MTTDTQNTEQDTETQAPDHSAMLRDHADKLAEIAELKVKEAELKVSRKELATAIDIPEKSVDTFASMAREAFGGSDTKPPANVRKGSSNGKVSSSEENRQAILSKLTGKMTVNDLAEATGLSVPNARNAVKALKNDRAIKEAGKAKPVEGQRGQPPMQYAKAS